MRLNKIAAIVCIGIALTLYIHMSEEVTNKAQTEAPSTHNLKSFVAPQKTVTTTVNQITPQVSAPETSHLSNKENLAPHPLFTKYTQLTPQQMLLGFFKDESLLKSRTELILQLIEQGYLNPNEQLREGEDSQHYTPLFAAAVTNPHGITPEQLQRFLDLGANIPPSGPWRLLLGTMPISDSQIIPMWFEASGLGAEHYEELFIDSALYGDSQLAEYIFEQANQGEYYKRRLEEEGLSKSLRDVVNFSFEEEAKRLELYKKDPKLNYLVQADSLLAIRSRELKQIAFWKKYADLTPEQIVELDATAIKIQSFTTELREQLAREQEAAGIR